MIAFPYFFSVNLTWFMNAFWMCVGSGPITFAYNSYYQRNIQNPKAKAQQVPKKCKECEAALVACKLKLTDTV